MYCQSLSFGCDLLENSYFCSIANNIEQVKELSWQVVICLKTRTFAVSQTTARPNSVFQRVLWFAWKLVLLQYRKQRSSEKVAEIVVVICLKTRTFAVSQTTTIRGQLDVHKLWFAWKLVLLQYRKQPTEVVTKYDTSCDLLENSYFCSIANNSRAGEKTGFKVVICLKTRTFAVSQTTLRQVYRSRFMLWFAWKLVLLQYRKQPLTIPFHQSNSCDLLENSYFCSIANNSDWTCSKRMWLWFAWKLVLLQYRKQRPSMREVFCSVVICLKTRTFAVSQTTRV